MNCFYHSRTVLTGRLKLYVSGRPNNDNSCVINMGTFNISLLLLFLKSSAHEKNSHELMNVMTHELMTNC